VDGCGHGVHQHKGGCKEISHGGVRLPDLLKQHDGGEDPYALAVRYFYHLQLGALPNRRVLFPTTAIGQLAKRVWDRRLARTKKGSFESASPDPEAPSPPEPVQRRLPLLLLNSRPDFSPPTTASSSSAARLPQDVVDMIVAYLIHDIHSLLACSLTSRSWYISAVPHLHRTLITQISDHDDSKNTEWPRPLQAGSEFGWLPFITTLSITVHYTKVFSPDAFRSSTQREFSALTNVRELYINRLDIPSFIPGIQWHFGQFSRTLRSLTLGHPKGSDWQILFFIGLFPHLGDLELYASGSLPRKPADLILVPPFLPSLRGRFRTCYLREDSLAKAMIELFGGVRFRHMDLCSVGGAQLLLYSCADALETFQLSASDICGGPLSLLKAHGFQPTILQAGALLGFAICQKTSLFENSKFRSGPSLRH
jgi:hypothetical protein